MPGVDSSVAGMTGDTRKIREATVYWIANDMFSDDPSLLARIVYWSDRRSVLRAGRCFQSLPQTLRRIGA
jgi:hypothetical protein